MCTDIIGIRNVPINLHRQKSAFFGNQHRKKSADSLPIPIVIITIYLIEIFIKIIELITYLLKNSIV